MKDYQFCIIMATVWLDIALSTDIKSIMFIGLALSVVWLFLGIIN